MALISFVLRQGSTNFGSSPLQAHHLQAGRQRPNHNREVRRLTAVKKTFSLMGLVALIAIGASAQDYPRVETFAGFTYTRANSASNVPAFSANGGGGQLAINPSKWVGFVMDIGSVHNGNISDQHLDSTFTNFLFGPRISLRYSRVRPYFNILFGGMHASTSIALAAVPIASQLPTDAGFPTAAPGQPVTLR